MTDDAEDILTALIAAISVQSALRSAS